jgi:hypothetical protein
VLGQGGDHEEGAGEHSYLPLKKGGEQGRVAMAACGMAGLALAPGCWITWRRPRSSAGGCRRRSRARPRSWRQADAAAVCAAARMSA